MRADAGAHSAAVRGAKSIAAVAAAAIALFSAFAAEVALATPSAPSARVRTLDEITIEGEIPLPQVLFVTASESARIESAFARIYTRSALEIGSACTLPAFLCMPNASEPPALAEEGATP